MEIALFRSAENIDFIVLPQPKPAALPGRIVPHFLGEINRCYQGNFILSDDLVG